MKVLEQNVPNLHRLDWVFIVNLLIAESFFIRLCDLEGRVWQGL
jgi:hypothetical protein